MSSYLVRCARTVTGRPQHHRPFTIRPHLLALAVLSLPWLPAGAQTAQSADPVVVTATRFAQPVSDALPSTTLLTRTDIDNAQALDLPALLRRQAGIEMAQTGGTGSQTSLFLRGTNSNHVLILIDGQRINSVGTGAAVVQHIPLDQIDHIEIVRGDVSALYGSEAIGGVIQIFTRSGAAPSLSATAEAGGQGNRALSVFGGTSFGQEGAKTRASLSVSSRESRGFSAIDADRATSANPDNDGYRNTSVSAQVAQQIDVHEIGVRLFNSEGRTQFDDPTDYSFIDPAYNGRIQTNVEHSRLSTGTVYAKLKPLAGWTADLQYGEERDRSANTSSNPDSFSSGTSESRTRQTSWNNTVALTASQTLTAGIEHLEQTGKSTSYTSDFQRHVDSALAGYAGRFGPHEVQINVRHDRYSDFGSADSGLAAYGYRIAPEWKAIAQISTAFKAPTFNELYFPFYGNPDLKPERARSAELGLQYNQGVTSGRLSFFRTRIRDLIVYDPNLFLANNIDRARISGVELSAATVLSGWDLSGNLTLQRPVDETSDQLLLRRATHNLNLAVARQIGPWRFSGDVQSSGARYDSDINTFARIQLAAYTVANLGTQYTVSRQLTVGLSLQNAFDKRYALVDGYNTQGRLLLGTASAKF